MGRQLAPEANRAAVLASPTGAKQKKSRRRLIYISYSHHDRTWFERLREILIPLARGRKIEVWDDTRLKPGDDIPAVMAAAQARTKVALFLVSPASIASKTIEGTELQPFLRDAETGQLRVAWIPVSAIEYGSTPLFRFQSLGRPSVPLDALPPEALEHELIDICKRLLDLVASAKSADQQVSRSVGIAMGARHQGREIRKIKILFLSANPRDTNALFLDEEVRAIEERIRATEYRESIEFITKWAVRPDDLLQALNQHRPHVVHFSGHGASSSEIIVLDKNGKAKPLSTAAVRSLFQTLRDNIRLVVLNACFSRAQADAAVNYVDVAIGMGREISDEAAIVFAAALYRAIGFGRSVREAFDQGVTGLLLEGLREESTPQLVARSGVDPADVFLVAPRGTDGD